jgi:TetR/AcrR family transcriptional repressor of bet genes
LPYEVVKRVGGRSYRYRVESYRDPQTGKPKGRWTYLGREAADVGAPRGAAPVRARAGTAATRARLIAALERLLETHEYAAVTANAIAREAGLAHGTFYRYFTDKRDALRAAVSQLTESIERGQLALAAPLGTREEERQRLRSFLTTTLTARIERDGPNRGLGLHRAWMALLTQDAQMAAARLARRADIVATLEAYLARLIAAGYATIDAPAGFARALFTLIDGAYRAISLEGRVLDDEEIAAIVTVADRGVFARSDGRDA